MDIFDTSILLGKIYNIEEENNNIWFPIKNKINVLDKINIADEVNNIVNEPKCKINVLGCDKTLHLRLNNYRHYFMNHHTKCSQKILKLHALCGLIIWKYQLCTCNIPNIIITHAQNDVCYCVNGFANEVFIERQQIGGNISRIDLIDRESTMRNSKNIIKDYMINLGLYKNNHKQKCYDFLNFKYYRHRNKCYIYY